MLEYLDYLRFEIQVALINLNYYFPKGWWTLYYDPKEKFIFFLIFLWILAGSNLAYRITKLECFIIDRRRDIMDKYDEKNKEMLIFGIINRIAQIEDRLDRLEIQRATGPKVTKKKS